MIGLKDLLSLLDRWDEWKQMRAAPARIDALEARLEEALSLALDPKFCPNCRDAILSVSIKNWRGGMGGYQPMQTSVKQCTSCGYTSTEERKISTVLAGEDWDT